MMLSNEVKLVYARIGLDYPMQQRLFEIANKRKMKYSTVGDCVLEIDGKKYIFTNITFDKDGLAYTFAMWAELEDCGCLKVGTDWIWEASHKVLHEHGTN